MQGAAGGRSVPSETSGAASWGAVLASLPVSCLRLSLNLSCRLAAGTTRFCAGIVSTARHVSIELKMADYSNKLYQQLEQETGVQTGTGG